MASFRDLKFLSGFITNRNKRDVTNYDMELVAKEVVDVKTEIEKISTVTSLTVTVPVPINEYQTEILDKDCTSTSYINIAHNPTSETDANSDDIVDIRAFPSAGRFTVVMRPVIGRILYGPYKLNYYLQ